MSVGEGTPAGAPLRRWDPFTIRAIEVFRVAMPVTSPYTTSFGSIATNETVLVRVDAGDVEGWGEATPFGAPEYSGEWAEGAVSVIAAWLAPSMVGATIDGPAAIAGRLARFRGNWFAKAAIDSACWGIAARLAGMPLYEAVGGRSAIAEVGGAFGIAASIDDLLAEIDASMATGIRRIKLKMTSGWEEDVVAAVRAAWPDALLHVDCNGHYTLDDAPLFRRLERYGLAMIEQPLGFDDLLDHAALQRQLGVPICLDESITSEDKARQAIEIGACRYVNIKPGRVGGISCSIAIDDVCESRGTPCWIGGMLESQLGEAICAALATRPNMRYPSDVFPHERFYRSDLATPVLKFERGANGGLFVRSAPTPGLPQVPLIEHLDAWTQQRSLIS